MLTVEIVYADGRGAPYVRDRFLCNGRAEAEVRARHELDVESYLASVLHPPLKGPMLARITHYGSVVWVLTLKERAAERRNASPAASSSTSHQPSR